VALPVPAAAHGGGEGLPVEYLPCVSDSRNDRTGTSVESHQVGEPMQTR
jgi:hypothetical protein